MHPSSRGVHPGVQEDPRTGRVQAGDGRVVVVVDHGEVRIAPVALVSVQSASDQAAKGGVVPQAHVHEPVVLVGVRVLVPPVAADEMVVRLVNLTGFGLVPYIVRPKGRPRRGRVVALTADVDDVA